MGLHRNARLGVAGRRALVADVEAGLSCRCAARRRGVSPTTACKWWQRWSQATLQQQQTLESFQLVARGHSNAEIARELVVSEGTVKTHVAHTLRKLDVRDRVHAVIYAYESGAVEASA
jgi:DNA-binding CsgD family transcriptional regulator